jgi:hypothetical protein
MIHAGGDDLASFVLPHQLQELMVLAGFDPAADAVVKLMAKLGLTGSSSTSRDGRISLEQFMHMVCHFREQPPAVTDTGEIEASTAAAAAAVAEVNKPAAAECEQGEAEEQWAPLSKQFDNMEGLPELDEDVFQQHIRAHQLVPPTVPQVMLEGSG